MKYQINANLYPNDYHSEGGSLAIKFPMNSPIRDSRAGLYNMSTTTEEQAVSNYINLLLTDPGERYMQPSYGVGLRKYIFEPNSKLGRSTLRNRIESQVAQWTPYIVNENLEIIQSPEEVDGGHSIIIRITFSTSEAGANRVMSVFVQGDVVTIDII